MLELAFENSTNLTQVQDLGKIRRIPKASAMAKRY